jgi:hypothetical protein
MTDYPVQLDVSPPAHFARIQLVLRIAFAIALGFIGATGGWLAGMLFLALPVFAAISISSYGVERYQKEVAPKVWRVIEWMLELSAFMMIVIDRFPVGHDPEVHVKLRATGAPTVGSALLRLLTSIPSFAVLWILACVSGFVTLISAILVLVNSPIPPALIGYQRGVLRWQARLLAYHASLVVEYPPFALDTEDSTHSTLAAQAR